MQCGSMFRRCFLMAIHIYGMKISVMCTCIKLLDSYMHYMFARVNEYRDDSLFIYTLVN
jgi:hypothetical protein